MLGSGCSALNKINPKSKTDPQTSVYVLLVEPLQIYIYYDSECQICFEASFVFLAVCVNNS